MKYFFRILFTFCVLLALVLSLNVAAFAGNDGSSQMDSEGETVNNEEQFDEAIPDVSTGELENNDEGSDIVDGNIDVNGEEQSTKENQDGSDESEMTDGNNNSDETQNDSPKEIEPQNDKEYEGLMASNLKSFQISDNDEYIVLKKENGKWISLGEEIKNDDDKKSVESIDIKMSKEKQDWDIKVSPYYNRWHKIIIVALSVLIGFCCAMLGVIMLNKVRK